MSDGEFGIVLSYDNVKSNTHTHRPHHHTRINDKTCDTIKVKETQIIRSQAFSSLTTLQSDSKTSNFTYILNTTCQNNHYYVLVQFTKNLNITLNDFMYHFDSNQTSIMILRYPRNQTAKSQLISIPVLDFNYINQQKLGWSDMSVSNDHIIISLFVFGSLTHNNKEEILLMNDFKIFKFNSENGKLIKDHTLSGFRKINVNTVGSKFYISGTGRQPMLFNGSPIPTTSANEDFFIALVDEKDSLVWARVGLSDTSQNVISTNSSEGAHVGEDCNLYTTGCFTGTIKLDVTYTSNNNNLQFWWGQIDINGKWVRSGVITGSKKSTDQIVGESISVIDNQPIITGTFVGEYMISAKKITAVTPSIFTLRVDIDRKSRKYYKSHNQPKNMICSRYTNVEQINPHISVDDDTIQLYPRLFIINKHIILYFYYDTRFEFRDVIYMSKGTTDLAILVLNSSKGSIKNIQGHTVNHGTNVLSGCNEILVGGSSLISNTRTNSFILTFRL